MQKRNIISTLYWACKIRTTNPCAEIQRKFLCMKKQICITTNDMLNSIPLVSKTMNFWRFIFLAIDLLIKSMMGQDLISTECEIKMLYVCINTEVGCLKRDIFLILFFVQWSVFGFPRSLLKIPTTWGRKMARDLKSFHLNNPCPQ